MKTILVDDMLLDLQLFELKCADMPDFEIVGKFTDPTRPLSTPPAMWWILPAGHRHAGDGRHPSGPGLRRLRSDIIIVFATAHPKLRWRR